MSHILIYLALFALVFLTQSFPRFKATTCTQLNFLPMPKKIECNISDDSIYKVENPCSILYSIKGSTE